MKIKTFLMGVVALLPICASATTLSVSKSDVSYYWSIDNSKFGGLKQQSKIEWKSSPIIISLSDSFSMGDFGILVGADTNAKFVDNDWCKSNDGIHCSSRNPVVGGDKVVNYSADSARASMYRVGVFYAGDMYQFGDVLGLDSLAIENKSTLYGDFYEAKGLYSDLYHKKKRDDSVVSNRTQKYVFESEYGLIAVKSVGGFVFTLMPFIGVHNMYMVDHHVLRRDTKNMRFTLLDTAIKYGTKFSVKHDFHGVDVTAGISYGAYKGLIAKAVLWKGDGRKTVGVGAGERGGDETSVYLNATYKF
ncbi:hypothetical protein [Photobacterium damselae]|uniref:hypothetical protein n=1 Tax=Photobacterium damselae TaxID=38293 RepID=UPI001F28ACCC|nr:hypothetical protein [Photobacterium damselae]UKA04465.1 hypothetical protein IHC89_22850 [Photobacterium damselae subsp. damselae]